jgi:ribonuclease BN (tRNA processing enzyme)
VLVTILGTRGNIRSSAPGYSKHSGVLVDGVILLDCGEKEYMELHPKYVFITHFHQDHAAIGAGDVPPGTAIWAPEKSTRFPMIRIISKPLRIGAYLITPVPTVHSQQVKSVGYLVEKNRRRFLFTSDLVTIKQRFRSDFKHLDLVITDGSFLRSKGLVRRAVRTGSPIGHNGIPDLIKFFSQFTKTIVITHYGTWFFKDIAASRRKIESLDGGVRILAAYDGMQLNVPPPRQKGTG